MAAKDNLQGEQLAMFMPAKELIKLPISPTEVKDELKFHLEHGNKATVKSVTKDLWMQKLDESQIEMEPGGALGDARLLKKYSRSKGSKEEHDNLYDSVADHGVINPVTLGFSSIFTSNRRNPLFGGKKNYIIGGHHRVAAANDINPNMEVPIRYHESYLY